MNSAQKGMQKSVKSTTATRKAFTEEERGAIRDRVQEMKAGKGEGETAVLAKIAEMREPDRSMAKRLHAIIKESAPGLSPRLWYGMPAYAKNDKVALSSIGDFLDLFPLFVSPELFPGLSHCLFIRPGE